MRRHGLQRAAWAVATAIALLAPSAVRGQTAEQLERIRNWNPQVKEFQKPGEIQKAGDIQVPRGIQAVRLEIEHCERRLQVGADALFAFDEWTLSPEAEETLVVLAPEIEKAGRKRRMSIEGHTDSKGSDDYNRTLSEKRAATVKEWLVARGAMPPTTPVVAHGESRPIAPNEKPDGSDDPEGRQKNRRVEVVIDTCASAPADAWSKSSD
jgi:outer membrane protein OmpA-like peptidoglycan-associated protein